MKQPFVSRTYRAEVDIDPSRVKEFIEVSSDQSSRYQDGLMPPMFATCLPMPAWERVFGDPDLGVNRFIILCEHDMRFIRRLRVGQQAIVVSRIAEIGDYGLGHGCLLGTQVLSPSGEVCVDMLTAFLVWQGLAGHRLEFPGDPPPPASHLAGRRFHYIPDDMPRRYALVSGDPNPIHLDDDAARLAGFDGIILHGLATLSLGGVVAIELVAGGDWSRIRRIRGRFARPVKPGTDVMYELYHSGKPGAFVVKAFSDRRAVLKGGAVELCSLSTS